MKKEFNKVFVNVFLVFMLICICGVFSNLEKNKVIAEESFSFDMVLEEAEQLTQTDILEGVLTEQIEYLELKNKIDEINAKRKRRLWSAVALFLL